MTTIKSILREMDACELRDWLLEVRTSPASDPRREYLDYALKQLHQLTKI